MATHSSPTSARVIPIILLGGLVLAWVLPLMSVSSFFFGEDYAVRLLGGELSVFSLYNELDAGWVPWLSLIGMLAAAAAAFLMERSAGRSSVVTLGALAGLVLPVMTILGAMEVNQESWGFLSINPGIGALTWILACVVAAILPWREG